jgi:hypothetical protein
MGATQLQKKMSSFKGSPLKPSTNLYDWLGNGIYFWENNAERAYQWAEVKADRGDYKIPAVIGAVIDLGYCLNLTNSACVPILKVGFEMVQQRAERKSESVPQNRGGDDLLIRELDCAVIEQIHDYNEDVGLDVFDSVRGLFIEENEIYPNSGFREKTHVQICIKNPNCIKGYFNPLEPDNLYKIP